MKATTPPFFRHPTLRLDPLAPQPRTDAMNHRLHWLSTYYGESLDGVREMWRNERLLEDERRALGLTSNISCADAFLQQSRSLGLHLLRLETTREHWHRDLFQALHDLVGNSGKRPDALFFGPTAGAEIEVMALAGARPHLSMAFGWALLLAEERLLADHIDFESVAYEDEVALRSYPYVVLSEVQPQPRASTRFCYDLLLPGGTLFVSKNALGALSALDELAKGDVLGEVVAYKKRGRNHVRS